jgi:uncharacterized membrane protein YgdD (TMEM256/DUF423 family)
MLERDVPRASYEREGFIVDEMRWGAPARESVMNGKICLLVASLALAAAVALGAFGAHALKSRLAPDMLAIYQTAVQYHFWHALGLFALGLLMLQWAAPALTLAGWLLLVGAILFSGSLYLLALTGARWLGAITPLGGIASIAAWLVVAWVAWLR